MAMAAPARSLQAQGTDIHAPAFQEIAEAAPRLDHFGAQLLAQPRHHGFHRIHIGLFRQAIKMVSDLARRDGPPGMMGR